MKDTARNEPRKKILQGKRLQGKVMRKLNALSDMPVFPCFLGANFITYTVGNVLNVISFCTRAFELLAFLALININN